MSNKFRIFRLALYGGVAPTVRYEGGSIPMVGRCRLALSNQR